MFETLNKGNAWSERGVPNLVEPLGTDLKMFHRDHHKMAAERPRVVTKMSGVSKPRIFL